LARISQRVVTLYNDTYAWQKVYKEDGPMTEEKIPDNLTKDKIFEQQEVINVSDSEFLLWTLIVISVPPAG
jgi:hypothetical protein